MKARTLIKEIDGMLTSFNLASKATIQKSYKAQNIPPKIGPPRWFYEYNPIQIPQRTTSTLRNENVSCMKDAAMALMAIRQTQ